MSRKQPVIALSLVLLFSLGLTFLFLSQPRTGAVEAQTGRREQDPFAIIKTIVVRGANSDTALPAEVTIVHAGISSGAETGKMLYVGDHLTTGRDTKVTILFLDNAAEKSNEVMVDSSTHVQLGSLFTWAGRILAQVKDKFQVKSTRVQGSVVGTEFELLVADDGTNKLTVLKGSVRVDSGTFNPTVATNPVSRNSLGRNSIFRNAGFHEPEPLQESRMRFVVSSGKVINAEREFILTNSCEQRHLFKVQSPLNLNWFQFLGGEQFAIEGKQSRTIRFAIRLDTTNVAPGTQDSQIVFPCLDCSSEPACHIGGLLLPITMIVAGPGGPTPTGTDEPAPLPTQPPTTVLPETTVAMRMQEIVLPPTGGLQKNAAPVADVDQALGWSNQVIVAGEPTYSAQSVAPRFQDWEERNRVFREARRSSIVNDDLRSKETLADLYIDWGNGAKAEEELKRLDPLSQETPERLTTLGEAHRLMGNLGLAEQLLRRALSMDPGRTTALNALGNVYLDQAKIEQDKGNNDAARAYFGRAKAEYSKALQVKTSSGPDEQNHARTRQGTIAGGAKTETVVHSNLGEVALRLGELARNQGNGADALSQFQAAEQSFTNAAKTDQGYQFAFTGLGDVYRDTGEILATLGNQRAAQYFARARDHYARALSLHDDMAEANVGLGRVAEATGREDEALQQFRRATQVRPELPEPHYYLAVALADVDPRAAAEQARAYLKIERPPFKAGEKGRNARLVVEHRPIPLPISIPPVTPTPPREDLPPPTPTPTPTPAPIQIGPPVKIPSMKGDKPESALQELKRKNLVGQLRDQRDCEATGKVLGTEPRSGTTVAANSEVIVFVSAPGENSVTMPALKRTEIKSAEAQLSQLDLHPTIKKRETDRDAPYTVIGQSPEGGKRLPAGCSVELTMAIPIPPVTVPDYRGRYVSSIYPSGDGLRIGNINEIESESPGGTVLQQSLEPGAVVPRGSVIDLTVSAVMVTVPDVYQMSRVNASNSLKAAGLVPLLIGDESPGASAYKQEPAAGTRVRRGTLVRVWFQIIGELK